MSLTEYVNNLAVSIDPAAWSQFGRLERMILERSMSACGMTEYPALSGPADGERCSGQMICEKCGLDYYSHPMDWRVIGYGNVPFLNVLCNGWRVKL